MCSPCSLDGFRTRGYQALYQAIVCNASETQFSLPKFSDVLEMAHVGPLVQMRSQGLRGDRSVERSKTRRLRGHPHEV
jgi:hypothetical protein